MKTIFLIILSTLVLVALAVLGLAISMIVKKDGKFPELHIGRNDKLKERGITCATTQDKMERKRE